MLYLKLLLVAIISMFNYFFVPNDVPATYKDTFTQATKSDYEQSFKIGSQIPNKLLTLKPYRINHGRHISPIGKVSSDATGKSGQGSTGFVIDKHTIITASHAVSDKAGNKETNKPFYFYPSKSNHDVPLKYKITKFYKVPNRDVAVLTTNQNLEKHIKPLQIAREHTIKNLQPKSPIRMLGYPHEGPFTGELMYESKGYFLKSTREDIEYMAHINRRVGFSGSPVLNKQNQVIGVHTHGIRPEMHMKKQSTRHLYSGGPLMTGKTRAFIDQHRK